MVPRHSCTYHVFHSFSCLIIEHLLNTVVLLLGFVWLGERSCLKLTTLLYDDLCYAYQWNGINWGKKKSTEVTKQTSCGHMIYYRKIPLHFFFTKSSYLRYTTKPALLHGATFRIVVPIQAYYKMQSEKVTMFDLSYNIHHSNKL